MEVRHRGGHVLASAWPKNDPANCQGRSPRSSCAPRRLSYHRHPSPGPLSTHKRRPVSGRLDAERDRVIPQVEPWTPRRSRGSASLSPFLQHHLHYHPGLPQPLSLGASAPATAIGRGTMSLGVCWREGRLLDWVARTLLPHPCCPGPVHVCKTDERADRVLVYILCVDREWIEEMYFVCSGRTYMDAVRPSAVQLRMDYVQRACLGAGKRSL